MDEIKNPKYIVGYYGHDYENISAQFLTRDDIEILNLITDKADNINLNENKISSFICEIDNFKENNISNKDFLYNLMTSNRLDGIPVIGIQREDTTNLDMLEFKNFVGAVDEKLNNWVKTPTLKCKIDVLSENKIIRKYSTVTDAVDSNKILNGTEYKNAMSEIKESVEKIKNKYISTFSTKIKEIIKENKGKSKSDMRKLISMNVISIISEIAVEMSKEVENQIAKQDKYTKGHVNSVTAIAKMIAEELSKDENIMEKYIKEKNPKEMKSIKELSIEEKREYKTMLFNDVSAAGLLHDAGKIAIAMNKYNLKDENGKIIGDYTLLNAPRKLTDEEFAVIQTHPDIGYNILMEVAKSVGDSVNKKYSKDIENSLKMIGYGILYHHERVDGNGYHGIPNEQIPVIAKIIQTADIYDALISERPYKFAWPDEFARKEMRREAGKQCDSKYLDALDSVIQKVRINEHEKENFSKKIRKRKFNLEY